MAGRGAFDATLVPAGWFDETAQAEGWFDRYLLDVGAPAAAGGHTSAVFLNPFGLGAGSAAPTLDLAQSGAIAITGAPSLTGTLGFKFDISQSGAIAVTGAPTLSGDISFKLNLSQSGQVSISGAPLLTGDVFTRVPLDIAQSGALAISGAPTLSGDLGLKFNVAQSSALAISGAPSLTGEIDATVYGFRSAVFLNPYGFGADAPGSLDLVQSGAIAIGGTPSLTGDIQPKVEFEFEPPLELSAAGTVVVSGDIEITGSLLDGFSSPVFLNPYGLGVPVAGGPFSLVQSGAIAISGAPTLTGDPRPVVEFPLEPPIPLDASGVLAVSGDIQITAVTNLVQSGALALAGTLFASANVQINDGLGSAGGPLPWVRRRRRM